MPHLVLADDSATIQKVVELTFADESVEVHAFSDGASALEHIRAHPVDIVLADVSLPFLDGYDLCQEIKQSPDTSYIPVVLLAGTFEPFDLERAERVGYHSHLTKPFETLRLVDLVKELLGAARPKVHTESAPAAEKRTVEGLLFHIPVEDGNGKGAVFSLKPQQCRPSLIPLKRHIQTVPRPRPESATPAPAPESAETPAVSLNEAEIEILVRRTLERLPDELRRILPQIAREVLKRD